MAIVGVYETFDGLADFDDFEHYLQEWIKPNLLKDLETVFEGASNHWIDARHPPGASGRGDFVMATALLSVFDHLGSFLATPVVQWITPAENIARIARRLAPSLSDIYAIVANMGRNALVHGAWPQTEIDLDVPNTASPLAERFGFGLSFNANADLTRSDTFHWKPFKPRPGIHSLDNCPAKTIKLVLNVHHLRRLLVDAIHNGTLCKVSQTQFDRVKDIAVLMGDHRDDKKAAFKALTKPGYGNETREKKVRRYQLCKANTMTDQIQTLLIEAIRLDVPLQNADTKIPRDYRGNLNGSDKEKERRDGRSC